MVARGREGVLELDPTAAAELLERARELAGRALTSPELLTDLLEGLRLVGAAGRRPNHSAPQLLGADGGAPYSDLVRLFLARALLSPGTGARKA